jgi:hypothetical protein
VNTGTHLAGALAATFLVAAVLAPSAPAQSRTGLTLGATASDLTGDLIAVQGDPKWGFYGGAFGEAVIGDVLALSLGVNYAQKGGRGLVGTGLLDSEKLELDLNYVELPLLVELTLPLGATWGLMAYSGVAVAFNVGCKALLGGGEKEACKDTALGGAKTELGLPVGGGLRYTLPNGESVVFEARYTWGQNDAVANASVRNGTWYFLIRLVAAN